MVDVLARTATGSRRAQVAAFAGHLIEWYEFSIYGLLAAYLSATMFPFVGRTTSLMLTWATFAVAFVVRPLGGVVLAGLADRSGRRTALMVTVGLMTLATVGIGILPGHSVLGVLAPVLFIGLRMMQGFAVGGEMPSAVPYFRESLPPGRHEIRAIGVLATAPWLAALGGALVAAALAATTGPEQMQGWGWRIPFLLALPLGLGVFWLRVAAPESAAFERSVADRTRTDRPVRTALRTSRRQIVNLTVLALVFNVAVSACVTGIPNEALLAGLPPHRVLWVSVTADTALVVAITVLTRVVEVVPRRHVVAGAAVLLLATVLPAVSWARSGQLRWALAACILLALPVGLLATPTYLAMGDLFPAGVRASASGIAFNAAAAVSSLVPATTLALRDTFGFTQGVAVWVLVAAVLALVVRQEVGDVDR